jgi:ribonucleoside-diphosphate reductase alpha chain
MTIEGAPGLKEEHLPVFDCANRCGTKGQRFIQYMAHLKFMAAAQPFLSGAISKTINMANEATLEDISTAYVKGWKLMLKAVALYRDGSKLSQPLNSVSTSEDLNALLVTEDDDSLDVADVQTGAASLVKRPLPTLRKGFTKEVAVGGHELVMRTGEYPDGTLGEVQVDMYKRGSSYGELMTAFSQAVSIALQHGVPLEEFVDTFTFTKFDPAGVVTGHPNIKNATSPVDFIFRSLAFAYQDRADLVHVKEKVEKSADEQSKALSSSPGNAEVKEAKSKGYTGEACPSCNSMRLRQNGTCAICEDCGNTTGCS